MDSHDGRLFGAIGVKLVYTVCSFDISLFERLEEPLIFVCAHHRVGHAIIGLPGRGIVVRYLLMAFGALIFEVTFVCSELFDILVSNVT